MAAEKNFENKQFVYLSDRPLPMIPVAANLLLSTILDIFLLPFKGSPLPFSFLA